MRIKVHIENNKQLRLEASHYVNVDELMLIYEKKQRRLELLKQELDQLEQEVNAYKEALDALDKQKNQKDSP